MGVRLIVEVLDHAPADIDPIERLLLVVIAESANDMTREGWPGMELLARRLGRSEQRVRAVLGQLAARGLEVRVALGVDKRGRKFYAVRGKRTTYRLPLFNGARQSSAIESEMVLASQAPIEEERRSRAEQDGAQGLNRMALASQAPFPQQPSGNPQQREGQPSDEERTAILAEIRRRKPGASEGLIRHVYRQDGPAILAEIREHAGRQHIAAWIADLATLPPCDHGQPGGDRLRPDTHEPHCALCRARRRQSAA